MYKAATVQSAWAAGAPFRWLAAAVALRPQDADVWEAAVVFVEVKAIPGGRNGKE